MKLYGRLLSILARSPFKERVKPLDKVVTQWTVLPNDLDVFGHMNNGRYAMVMDLARVDLIARLGMLGKILKNRWIIPVGNTQIEYRRPLKPFAKYEIHTQLVYWDESWFYFKQEFIPAAQPDRVAATGYVKAIFKDKQGIISTEQVIDEVMSMQAAEDRAPRPYLSDTLALKFGIEKSQHLQNALKANQSQQEQNATNESHKKSTNDSNKEPIAIVGIGCRFPGGVENPEDLWEVLIKGKDCIVDIPSTRWDPKKFYDPSGQVPGKAYVNKGGILTQNIYDFDPSFFGIAPREAEILDPMQRLLLEVSWEAFEDAGISPISLAGSNTSVYVGGFVVDSMIHQYSPLNRNLLGPQSATASSLTLLANRLSYFYDFRGASVSLDTACSSSLVAVHHACQSIWNGDSDAALVGGVNMLLTPETHITMCKGKFLSPNGRCNTFGAGADGYVRGEGAALVVLKPLSKALADGNQIYSVIRGAAVNQDGRTNGITVPNGDSQVAAMRSALSVAQVEPEQIAYMEAHGTGTPVGDPIEARALSSVFGINRENNESCPIGSLKTNLGHMEACAGVGGLIKASMVLKKRQLVPHLHLEEVNPNIDLDALKLRVPTANETLSDSGELYAGVNSFGYGGTNAHVILASPPVDAPALPFPSEQKLSNGLLLSAASAKSLQSQASEMSEFINQSNEPLDRLGTALATQRAHLPYRAWIDAEDKASATEALCKLARGVQDEMIVSGHQETPKLCFVYTGMGPQWWAMGRELYHSEPIYKKALDECDCVFESISGWSLLTELLAEESASKITQTQIAQPANLAVQVALTRLFSSWGIESDAVVGHSIGEVGSAWASGRLSLEQAFLVAFHRSRLQATTAGKGGMLAVGLSSAEVTHWLTDCSDKVSIAAINSPSAVTLAGDIEVLSDIAKRLEIESIFNKFLKVEVPYHSPIMDEIETELKDALTGLSDDLKSKLIQGAQKPLYSTVTTKLMDIPHDGDYWWRNVREPVRFASACEQALNDGYNIFVEIGPHPVLSSSIREIAKSLNKSVTLCPSLVRKENEPRSIGKTIRRLYCSGINLDWEHCFGRCSHVDLPLYAWDKKEHRQEGLRTRQYRLPFEGHPLIARTTSIPTPTWHIELNAYALPYVQDHKVGGNILFPGAGYIELGLALAKEHLQTDESMGITLEAIEFLNPAVVPEDENVGLAATANAKDRSFEVRYKRGEGEAILSAKGKFFRGGFKASDEAQTKVYSQITKVFENAEQQSKSGLYESLSEKGLVYGNAFQAVESIRVQPNEVLAEIQLSIHLNPEGYLLHPVILDAALHSLIAATESGDKNTQVIPMGIDRIQWNGTPPNKIFAHGRIIALSDTVLAGDIDLFDVEGNLIIRLEGLNCRVMQGASASILEQTNQWTYHKEWELLDTPSYDKTIELEELSTATFIIHEQLNDNTLSISQGLPADHLKALPQSWSNQKLKSSIKATLDQGRSASIIDLRLLDETNETSADMFMDIDVDVYVDVDLATKASVDVLNTLQELMDIELSRYMLMTCNGQKVLENDELQIQSAITEGMTRTAMTECPQLNVTLLDIDDPSSKTDLCKLRSIWESVTALGDEQELALREGAFHALRLNKYTCTETIEEPSFVDASDVMAYELKQTEKGKIDSLEYHEAQISEPESGEVMVKMAYSSLHFKDLMKVLGLLSSDALSNTFHQEMLGMEGTGIVERVGEDVEHLSAGDRVYVWGQTMNSHLTVPTKRAIKLPPNADMADSANLVTYFTVYHSFVEMARVQAGETILVHSATGGVGLAAIYLARYLGAKVIATAGTKEKRDYLRSLGVQYVGDSRSLAFVDQVKTWTQGQGVDVVLNFTPGETMHKSIDCLAPSGRFIELGKQSFEGDERINLKPFTENLNYIAVDFDRLTNQRPDYVLSITDKVIALLQDDSIPPLPCEYFSANQTKEAFKTMSRGEYFGKIAIKQETENLKVLAQQNSNRFSKEASYLVTGGLGGFGLQVAQWMSKEGAGHLILLSRSGPRSEEAITAIEKMREQGTQITALSCDVSDLDQLEQVLNDALQSMPSLKGIMHAAMVLDDKMIGEIDDQSMRKVINAKTKSAWNLHQLTQGMDLEFMVLFSSISSLVGNAGQANYVAANNFLDQLAHYRQSRGLAATSINWGVFLETGVVARNEQLSKHLGQIGITPFSTQQALDALGIVLKQEKAQVGVMDVNWQRFESMQQENTGKSRFKQLLRDAESQGSNSQESQLLHETFSNRNHAERAECVRQALAESVATVMRVDIGDLNPSKSLRDLGLDSLMAVEIDVEFSSRTGLDIPTTDIASGPSLEELEQRLLKRLAKTLPVQATEEATDRQDTQSPASATA